MKSTSLIPEILKRPVPNKKIGLFFIICFLTLSALAQVPQKMSYQAVIRNASGTLLNTTNVGMKISILSGASSGPVVYAETQTVTSNANGLVTIEIGAGTLVSGTFSAISWGTASHFIKTETDPAGGSNYSIIGTSQLLSVPYALYAANSPSGTTGPAGPAGPTGPQGPQGQTGPTGPAGTFTVPFGTTLSSSNYLIDLVNPGSNGVIQAFSSSVLSPAINAKLSSTTGAGFLPVIRGDNMATGIVGIGVQGSHAGAGWGVYGITSAGAGVYGQATSAGGTGVYGKLNSSGSAIYGDGNNTGYAGIFQGGNVGIGTTGPSSKLEVWGPSTGSFAAVQAISLNTTNPALEVSGPLKVSGVNPAAFIVQGQTSNSSANGYISGNLMMIDNALCNSDPNAILIITHNYSANSNNTYLNVPCGVYYTGTRWYIYTENISGMPLTSFNVLVIKR